MYIKKNQVYYQTTSNKSKFYTEFLFSLNKISSSDIEDKGNHIR